VEEIVGIGMTMVSAMVWTLSANGANTKKARSRHALRKGCCLQLTPAAEKFSRHAHLKPLATAKIGARSGE
jgi:hypothetical protein